MTTTDWSKMLDGVTAGLTDNRKQIQEAAFSEDATLGIHPESFDDQTKARALTHSLKVYSRAAQASLRHGIDMFSPEHVKKTNEFMEQWNGIVDVFCSQIYQGAEVPEYVKADVRNGTYEITRQSLLARFTPEQTIEHAFNNQYIENPMSEIAGKSLAVDEESELLNAGVSISRIKSAIMSLRTDIRLPEGAAAIVFGQKSAGEIARECFDRCANAASELITQINVHIEGLDALHYSPNRNAFITMHVGNIVSEITYNRYSILEYAKQEYKKIEKGGEAGLLSLTENGIINNWVDGMILKFHESAIESQLSVVSKVESDTKSEGKLVTSMRKSDDPKPEEIKPVSHLDAIQQALDKLREKGSLSEMNEEVINEPGM